MASDWQIYIDFDPYENGLLVGLACQRLGENEFIGVCIFNDDAQRTLFRLVLDAEQEPELFLATAGGDPGAGWAYNFANIQPDLQPPVPMDADLAKRLADLADHFLSEWFWFDDDPDADVLAAQFQGLGFEVFRINLRPEKLAGMEAVEADDADDATWLVYDTVSDAIIKNALEEYVLSPMS